MGHIAVYTQDAQHHFFHPQGQAQHRGDSFFADILGILKIVFLINFADGIVGAFDDTAVDGAFCKIDASAADIILAETVSGAEAQSLALFIQQLDGAGLNSHNRRRIAGGGVHHCLQLLAQSHFFDHLIKRFQLGVAGIQFLGYS